MKIIRLIVGVFAMSLTAVMLAAGGQVTVDDFESGPEQRWRFVADTVMGGRSTGQVEFKTSGGEAYARLTGDVTTANNGGFIQVRRELKSVPDDAQGVRLVVRGNGERYFVHLRTSGTILPWQYYQAGFSTSGAWREVRLPLESFKRSGRFLGKTPKASSLKSIGIVAFGRDHKADVEIREVGFY
jgi:RNase P/RNase MRP subunit POP5